MLQALEKGFPETAVFELGLEILVASFSLDVLHVKCKATQKKQ